VEHVINFLKKRSKSNYYR